MAPPSSARALKKPLRLDDEVRFLRSWIEKPLHVGAVMPSSKVLARAVAQYVDPHASAPVIELGPGTGAITDALLGRGVAEKRLVLVEFDPGFCALLRERFPRATVVQGDAYALSTTLAGHLTEKAIALVSSLPLFNRPPPARSVHTASPTSLGLTQRASRASARFGTAPSTTSVATRAALRSR